MERRLTNQAIFRRKEVVGKSATFRCRGIVFPKKCASRMIRSILRANEASPCITSAALIYPTFCALGRHLVPVVIDFLDRIALGLQTF